MLRNRNSNYSSRDFRGFIHINYSEISAQSVSLQWQDRKNIFCLYIVKNKNDQETSFLLKISFQIDSIFPLLPYHFIGINCTVGIYEYVHGIILKRLMICQCVIITEFLIFCGDVNYCFLHDTL